jgi:hypothetical protein
VPLWLRSSIPVGEEPTIKDVDIVTITAIECADIVMVDLLWKMEGVNIVIGIQVSFASGAFDIVTGDVERLGGRPPKPLRDALAGALKCPSA